MWIIQNFLKVNEFKLSKRFVAEKKKLLIKHKNKDDMLQSRNDMSSGQVKEIRNKRRTQTMNKQRKMR